MSSYYAEKVYNGPEKFVVSMDIGTTQSAVSFAHFVPGVQPQVKMVTHWPEQAQSSGAAKIPTIVSYQAGVMRACGEEALPDLINENMDVAYWFKLHLHPSTMARSTHFEMPKLPPGISVERAYTDMMRYLMDNTRKFFERTTPNGDEIWARLCDKIIIVLATPNGWNLREHDILRTAAVKAGMVTPENAYRLLRFVAEAEAAVHYALAHYSDSWLESSTVFAVVDAGGATVDITVYKCASTDPLRVREVCPSECVQAGGIFVNRAVENILSGRLQGSAFEDPIVIQNMMDFFERELKPKFDGSQSSYQIRFGTSKDTAAEIGIHQGTITIPMKDLKAAFDIVVDQIVTCCTNALRNYKAKCILLVGGFGESPYLRKALADKFGSRGTRVIVVGDYSRKAAAEGATIRYTKQQLVEARAARVTFGGCVRQRYDHKLHRARKRSAYIYADGKRRVDNAFHPWVIKGTYLEDTLVHRLHYHSAWNAASMTTADLAAQLGRIKTEVYAWEGDGPIPRWCKDEEGYDMSEMRLMCTLDADLSTLASSLKVLSGSRGAQFYRVDYDVCVYFGGTELQASLEWRDGAEIRRCTVSVIPSDANAQ